MHLDPIARSTLLAVMAGSGFALAAALLPACSSDKDEKSCPVGSEGCRCTPGGSCDSGLSCYSDFCVSDATAAAGAHSAGGPSTGGETDSENGGSSHRRAETGGAAGDGSPTAPGAGRDGSPHAAGSGDGSGEGNAGAAPEETGGTSHGEIGGAPSEQNGGAAPEETGGTSHGEIGGAPSEQNGGSSHGEAGGSDAGATAAAGTDTGGTSAAGGAQAAGAGGQPEPESPLTCEGDTCCFEDCTGNSRCGMRDFDGCADLGDRCGVEPGMCTTIVLPSWWKASGCVVTWTEGGYGEGESPVDLCVDCPCSTAQGFVAASPCIEVPAGAECDFSEVAPVSCEELDTSECL